MAQAWWQQDPLLEKYHNDEWGVPKHDDQVLFELLSMEILQAGLNWLLVLKKRAAFNQAFDQFDIAKVSKMTPAQLDALMQDARLIRNRCKLEAIVANAQAILKLHADGQSFDAYLWHFTAGRQLVNQPQTQAEIPAQTPLSQAISKDMKKRGFKFVGPVIIYSFLQGSGVVDDHLAGWRRANK